MKRLVLLFAASLAFTFVSAQEKPRFNPDHTWNTIRAEFGMLVPISPGNPVESGEQLSLTYTRRFTRHWGWRTGLQYATDYEAFDDHFGLPLSIVYRSGTYGFQESVRTSARSAASLTVWDALAGYDTGSIASHTVRNFLFFVFRRAEGFVGITPGYVFGNGTPRVMSSWNDYEEGVRLNSRFTLTADAGYTLSIPIWRFSLEVTPGFHYLITNNFSQYHQSIDPATGRPVGQPSLKPLRWQFSLTGGLSFLF